MVTGEGLLLHPVGSRAAIHPSPPRMAYLFACNVGTLVSFVDTHNTRVSHGPSYEPVCVPAARLCIYASGTKPPFASTQGNVLSLKTRDRKVSRNFRAKSRPGSFFGK